MVATVNTITFQWNRIGIVGAGPAGLVAALILQLHGLACTVFDRESSAVARAQGGILDMHIEGGQFAFRQCRLFDEFRQVARYDEQEMTLYDKRLPCDSSSHRP